MKMEYTWAMPNKWTFEIEPIKKFIARYLIQNAYWIDPFCGNSKLAAIRNDLCDPSAEDSHIWLDTFKDYQFDGAFFDPPYSMEQVKRSYNSCGLKYWQKEHGNQSGNFPKIKDKLSQIVKPEGYILSFGWNSSGMGKKRGFMKKEILLVAHGGNRHDTICISEQKIPVEK